MNVYVFTCPQIRFCCALIDGHFKLPSVESMLDAEQRELDARTGEPKKNSHLMAGAQWAYLDAISKEAGFANPIKDVVPRLYSHTAQLRATVGAVYKRVRFRMTNDGSDFEVEE